MLEEEISSDFGVDSLLASYQNGHLREAIHDHKHTVITMLGLIQSRCLIHGDGFPWPNMSRYRCVQSLFFMVGFVKAQVVQDLIY